MRLTAKEITVFGMLGAVMYASKMLMELFPNIHLLGTFVVALTVHYRKKALYPIYIFVLITGLFSGFAPWWAAYIYIWAVLWAAVMLLPKNIPVKLKPAVYMLVCAMHGFMYGVLYAPAQALMFGLNFEGTVAWVMAGLPFDVIHGISNFFCGILICPLIWVFEYCEKHTGNY